MDLSNEDSGEETVVETVVVVVVLLLLLLAEVSVALHYCWRWPDLLCETGPTIYKYQIVYVSLSVFVQLVKFGIMLFMLMAMGLSLPFTPPKHCLHIFGIMRHEQKI